MFRCPLLLTEPSISTRSDAYMNGVCLDRSNVDFGFSSAGGQETITLTNNSDTEVSKGCLEYLMAVRAHAAP